MAINRCDPCCQIGGNLSDQVFYQNALQVLCNISAGITPGGQSLTPLAPQQVVVGPGSIEIVASNSARRGLILVNTSANVISLAFGLYPAVLYSGATLEPNGGAYNMTNFDFTTGAVNAIASGVGSIIAIQEYL